MKRIILILLCLYCSFRELYAVDFPKIQIIKTSEKAATGYYYIGGIETKLSIMDLYGNIVKPTELSQFDLSTCFEKHVNGMFTLFHSPSLQWYVLDKNLKLLDSLKCDNGRSTDFHDIKIKRNGNYLIFGQDTRLMDLSEYNEGKSNESYVVGFELQEFTPTKENIWRWSTFDHFHVTDAVGDIDLAAPIVLYCHVNSYIEDTDGNYIISSRHLDELTKINKTTGAIIWRMGGSTCKNNQFEFINDEDKYGFKGFSHQHDPVRLANGNLLLFDNGNSRKRPYSRAVEYEIDEVNKKVKKVWEYISEDSLFAPAKGNAQRLDNGNTVIHWNELVTEVTPNKEVVHEFKILDDNTTYRIFKYKDFVDFVEKNISTIGSYEFKNSIHNTTLTLNFTNLVNGGNLLVEKHHYAIAHIPLDSGNVDNTIYPVRYLIKSKELNSFNASVKIPLNTITGYNASDSLIVLRRKGETLGNFYKLNSFANKSTGNLEFKIDGLSEIVIAKYGILPAPTLAMPTNNQTGLSLTTTFKWNEVPNATLYRLILENAETNTVLMDTTVNVLTISYSKLSNYTQYKWKVLAQNFNATSAFSSYSIFQTRISSPSLMTPKNEESKFNFKLDSLTWSVVQNASSYNLEICENITFDNSVFRFNNLINPSYLSPNLANGKQYYWRVIANNSKGNSNWSEVRTFYTTEKDPILFSPNPKSVLQLSANKLVWKQKNVDDFYTIEVSTSSDFSTIYTSQSKIDTNFYDLPLLEANKQYFWRVRIDYEEKESDWSLIWNFYTVLENAKLLNPKYDEILKQSSSLFVWSNVAGADKYILELSLDKNFSELYLKLDTLTNTQIELKSLPESKKLYWRVNAVSNVSYSNYSKFGTFSTPSNIFLNEPMLKSPSNSSEVQNEFVLFEWDKNEVNSELIESYSLQLSEKNDFSDLIIDTFLTKERYINSTALLNDKTYYWRVRNIGNTAYSNWSEVWKFNLSTVNTFSKAIPIFPINKTIVDSAASEFAWGLPHYQGNYYLEIATNIEFTKNKIEKELKSQTTIVNSLLPKQSYYWRVASVENSQKVWSDIAEFSTSDFVISSVEIDESGAWKESMYDKNTFIFEYNASIKLLKVFDINGKSIVYNAQNDDKNLQLVNFHTGAIFIMYEMNNKQYLVKFIK